MKQIMTISAALLFLTIGEVQAQNGIEQVLKNIETNNKELQANEQLITSQKLEAKTDNNLPDPTLSYAHLWGPGSFLPDAGTRSVRHNTHSIYR